MSAIGKEYRSNEIKIINKRYKKKTTANKNNTRVLNKLLPESQ
jgi:hypothetical protein